MGSALFMAGENMVDTIAIGIEGIIEGKHRPAGKPEDRIDALFKQTFQNDFGTT